MNEQNENKGSSKSSESDKMFSKSNSNENRNRSMIGSSNPEKYPSAEGISNRDNLIFFSSSGSDQWGWNYMKIGIMELREGKYV